MDILSIIAIILALIGIVGDFLPVIPGPPLSWCAMLCLYFSETPDEPLSRTTLIVFLVLTIIITVMDYFLPGKITKLTGGHKAAERGATIGLFAGLIFTPVGMILGSLIGAFIGEFCVYKQDFAGSVKAALGSFLGFILSTGIKLIFSLIIIWKIIRCLI